MLTIKDGFKFGVGIWLACLVVNIVLVIFVLVALAGIIAK